MEGEDEFGYIYIWAWEAARRALLWKGACGWPWGNGHIGTNYVYHDVPAGRRGEPVFVTSISCEPDRLYGSVSLMDNILHVTEYLKDQIRGAGGDPHRETCWTLSGRRRESHILSTASGNTGGRNIIY